MAFNRPLWASPVPLLSLALFVVSAALLGVLISKGEKQVQKDPICPPPSTLASTSKPAPAPVPAGKEGPYALSPKYTAIPVPLCSAQVGQHDCVYESCALSKPRGSMTNDVLWNTYVIPGKEGPVLICEWQEPLRDWKGP